MMSNFDPNTIRMAVAHKMMQDYDPATLELVLERMENASRYPSLLARKIREDGITQQTIREMKSYSDSMFEIFRELMLHYALTGRAGEDMMQNLTESIRKERDSTERDI